MPPSAKVPAPLLAVGLGESLFDCFSPDRRLLGGAPLNFAVHAQRLLEGVGGGAAVATRIGADELGDRVVDELRRRGLSLAGLQRDAEAPTGVVAVTIDATGSPSYDIRRDAAWDRCEFDAAWAQLAADCDAVCFGTLAQRSSASRAAIAAFLAAAEGAVRLCDLNLRAPHYDEQAVRTSLTAATVLKLNESELPIAAELLDLPARAELAAAAGELLEAFTLDAVIVTRGAAGAMAVTGEETISLPGAPFDPQPGADSVGAGDACSAGIVVGMLLGWPWRRTLELGNAMGAYVAARPGATPELPGELVLRVQNE
ncbi:MAG: hypothetical protein KF847_09250 [Pirellulales bacterium]|nr:hypothetical protein [Pirellulales bacterium]